MPDPGLSRLSEWIEEYGPGLLAVARAFARAPDDAEDILQDAWVIAMRRQHTLAADAAVGAWLHRIVLNVGRSRARKAAKRWGLLARWLPPPADRPADRRTASLEGEQVIALLWREIAELPELQRQVLLLRIVEALSTEETAQVIHRAQGTVKASLHRALRRLEARMRDHGVESTALWEM